MLGAVVEAVRSGRRSGKHPDPSVRPPSAEADDGPFLSFWEVLGLRQLETARPLSEFETVGGGSSFHGNPPQWPTMAQLDW